MIEFATGIITMYACELTKHGRRGVGLFSGHSTTSFSQHLDFRTDVHPQLRHHSVKLLLFLNSI